jgi:hypothetical protein
MQAGLLINHAGIQPHPDPLFTEGVQRGASGSPMKSIKLSAGASVYQHKDRMRT